MRRAFGAQVLYPLLTSVVVEIPSLNTMMSAQVPSGNTKLKFVVPVFGSGALTDVHEGNVSRRVESQKGYIPPAKLFGAYWVDVVNIV